jgi:transcriptional regulator with XRE-family HTH domain
MNIGKTIADLREDKGWNQTVLSEKSGVSRVMVGKYERGDALPSIDAAKKIADALGVSLDRLVGDGIHSAFDKKTLKRLEEIARLSQPRKTVLFDLIDTYIRDSKTRETYSQ